VTVALPLIFGMVGFCTLHLLVGIWLGIRFRAPGTARGAEINHHYNVQLAEVARLSDQLRRFAALCTSQFPALPATITAAADELAKAAALLNARMQSSKDEIDVPSRAARRRRPTPPIEADTTGFGLDRNELDSLASIGRPAGDQSEQTARATRYRYDTIQFAASYDGGLPQPAAFKRIRTLDLSSGGLSYFTEEQRAQRSIVVSLGNAPDLCFFVATVEHSRPVYMYGVPGYVVGCRFVNRLEDVFTWDESVGWIVLNLDFTRQQATGLEQMCDRR